MKDLFGFLKRKEPTEKIRVRFRGNESILINYPASYVSDPWFYARADYIAHEIMGINDQAHRESECCCCQKPN